MRRLRQMLEELKQGDKYIAIEGVSALEHLFFISSV